ncbi:hypothetical protein HYW76_04770 [Candidatus Pacearchaeota archaeon]|nr:hypothetical protein [Candidatus Pacearchaeota archaeon]
MGEYRTGEDSAPQTSQGNSSGGYAEFQRWLEEQQGKGKPCHVAEDVRQQLIDEEYPFPPGTKSARRNAIAWNNLSHKVVGAEDQDCKIE